VVLGERRPTCVRKSSLLGFGVLLVMGLVMPVTVSSVLAAGPPEWAGPPNVLMVHFDSVLMAMTFEREKLATKWKAEIARHGMPRRCSQSDGWREIDQRGNTRLVSRIRYTELVLVVVCVDIGCGVVCMALLV